MENEREMKQVFNNRVGVFNDLVNLRNQIISL